MAIGDNIMQTFLPYPDFTLSAMALDTKRLGKQRVECKQILLALEGASGWSNHPVTKMWSGCESALAMFGASCCKEWLKFGYEDNLHSWFCERLKFPIVFPWWWGGPIHDEFKAVLLHKDRKFYSSAFVGIEPQERITYPVRPEYPGRYAVFAFGEGDAISWHRSVLEALEAAEKSDRVWDRFTGEEWVARE